VPCAPPSGNTGGKNNQPTYEYTDPETGEISLICPTGLPFGVCNLIPISTDGVHPYAAITDYLNCTFKFDPEEESFADLFQELFDLLGEKFSPAIDRHRGLHGYTRSFQLGESSAQLAIGGQGGTVLLSMPGEACSLLHQNWANVVAYLHGIRNAHITRWDGAVPNLVIVQNEAGMMQSFDGSKSSHIRPLLKPTKFIYVGSISTLVANLWNPLPGLL